MATVTPAPTRIPDSQKFRTRAEECRALAESFTGQKLRIRMQPLAVDYDRMALQAAAQELAQADRGVGS
jgi:hypothetical protein